jgi:hypothetical protein
MRSIAKVFVGLAVAAPLVVGGAGMAAAHEHDGGPAYKKTQNSAGIAGGTSSGTVSGFLPDGTAYFGTFAKVAGPTGAVGTSTGSHS